MIHLHGLLILGLLSVAQPIEASVGRAACATPVDQLDDLKVKLRSDDDRERRAAVTSLAQLGGEEAWSLVVSLLADDEAQVADQAQIELAGVPDAHLKELFGKQGLGSRRGNTALRVAEALGRRASAPDQSLLIKALKHKDEDVRRSLLWSVERLARNGHLDGGEEKLTTAIEKAAERGGTATLRAQALVTLGALTGEKSVMALLLVLEWLESKHPEQRAAALELAELVPEEIRLFMVRESMGDREALVRLRAYQALERRRDREGVRALVDSLEAEANLRLSWTLVEILRGLSGRKHGRDVRPWSQWAETLADDWAPAKADGSPQALEGEERTASFVGLPVLSERVAFLIDFSGSMWQERDGKTRKQRVDVELRRALESLPESTRFNLHPYTLEPLRWQKKLTTATAKNVQRALKYFEDCQAHGKGNFWDAALDAMQDPEVDTLMLLTDGAPSGGQRWNMDLIKDLFVHENRFRGVFVDALLVDTKGRLVGYWDELTAGTGGRMLQVEL